MTHNYLDELTSKMNSLKVIPADCWDRRRGYIVTTPPDPDECFGAEDWAGVQYVVLDAHTLSYRTGGSNREGKWQLGSVSDFVKFVIEDAS